MADITKCKDEHCPLKKTCYRYTAKEGFFQSYFLESPRIDQECDYYWEDKQTNIKDDDTN